MTVRQKVENGRAAFAFEVVKKFKDRFANEPQTLKEYRSYVKKMPAIIQVNGIGQAMAFYYSQRNKSVAYKQVYDDLSKWIEQSMNGVVDSYRQKEGEPFIEILVKMISDDYRLVTMEALAMLNWMRRFVDGMIQEDNK